MIHKYIELLNKLCEGLVHQGARAGIPVENISEPQSQRLELAFSYYKPKLEQIFHWLYSSREDTNFTYDLDDLNKDYLASMIAIVCNTPTSLVRGYLEEPTSDQQLLHHVANITSMHPGNHNCDSEARFGRRLGWYAVARAMKPKVIVETGVDKGLGSCLLSAALLKNAAEGAPGRYYGTDIDPSAGYLYKAPYSQVGEILYGDSIGSLQKFDREIDLFINDSDHSAEYEAREYGVITPLLSKNAVVLGDNSHITNKLFEYSQKMNRDFFFFQEKPKDHWYPGAGIGISFKKEGL